jgi:hypothetical protein
LIKKKNNFFPNFWSLKPWIRIGIQPKMLDPDPDEMNADPQPCLEDHLLPGLQRRELAAHGIQPLAELLTGEAHRMAVDVGAGAAAWVQSCVVDPELLLGMSDPDPENIIPDPDPVPDS